MENVWETPQRNVKIRKHLVNNVVSKIGHFVDTGLSKVLGLYTRIAFKYFRLLPQGIVACQLIVCSMNVTTVFFFTRSHTHKG